MLFSQGRWRRAAAEIAPPATMLAEVLLPLALVGLVTLFVALSTEQGRLEDLVQRQANAALAGPPAQKIAVVQIDDATRQAFGVGADSRAMINCLVRQLARAQPRVIALDYVFGDQPRVPDIVPSFCEGDGSRLHVPDGVPLVVASVRTRAAGYLQEVPPSPTFVDLARVHAGYAELVEDRHDGTVRGVILSSRDDTTAAVVPSLALATWHAATRDVAGEPRFEGPVALRRWLQECEPGRGTCPAAAEAVQRIRFLPPDSTLRLVSAATVFSESCLAPGPVATTCPLHLLRDRIVFLGSSHAAANDHFRTPLFSDLPFAGWLLAGSQEHPVLAGVVVHALVAQNLLGPNGFVQPLPLSARLGLSALVLVLPLMVALLLLALVHGARAPATRVLAGLAFVLLMLAFAWAGYRWAVAMMAQNHLLVPLSLLLPLFGLGLLLAAVGILLAARARALAAEEFAFRLGGPFAAIAPDAYVDLAARVRRGHSLPTVWMEVEFRPVAGRDAPVASDLARLQRDLLADLPLASAAQGRLALPILSPLQGDRCVLYIVVTDTGRREAATALDDLALRLQTRPPRFPALGPLACRRREGTLRIFEVCEPHGRTTFAFTNAPILPDEVHHEAIAPVDDCSQQHDDAATGDGGSARCGDRGGGPGGVGQG